MTAKEVYLVLNLYTKTKKFFLCVEGGWETNEKNRLVGLSKGDNLL